MSGEADRPFGPAAADLACGCRHDGATTRTSIEALSRPDWTAVDLHIDDAHVGVLRDVLDAALRDLRFEIADTDDRHYKQQLRERESVLRDLLEPLGGPLPDPR